MIRRTLITLVRLTVLVGLGVGFYLENVWIALVTPIAGFVFHEALRGRKIEGHMPEPMTTNPATGLYMPDGTIDVGGNPNGIDLRDDRIHDRHRHSES
jgi:hypothetical protein